MNTLSSSLLISILVIAPMAARGQSVPACAQKNNGQLRILNPGDVCNASEVPVQLSTPRPLPDLLPLAPNELRPVDTHTAVTGSSPFARLEPDAKPPLSTQVRRRLNVEGTWTIDPAYSYDALYLCLSFDPRTPPSDTWRMEFVYTENLRANAGAPMEVKRYGGRLVSTIADFQNTAVASIGIDGQCLTVPFQRLASTGMAAFSGPIRGGGFLSVDLQTPELLEFTGQRSRPESLTVRGFGLTISGPAR